MSNRHANRSLAPLEPGPALGGGVLSRRTLLRASVLAAVGAVAAACASRTEPGRTYGPTIAPSAGSAGPSTGQSAAAPSPSAVAPSASPPGGGAGVVIRIVALNFKFDLTEFSVPANTPFQMVFDNQDPGIPHNVAIYQGQAGGPTLFAGEIFNGVKTVTYEVPGLPAGDHYFQCDVHPMMNGTLRAA